MLTSRRGHGGHRETGTHLWASVNQGGEDLEGEGSSARATSWYDTNYQYANDPAGQTIACDGHWHATRFLLKLEDGLGYSYGWKTGGWPPRPSRYGCAVERSSERVDVLR